MPREWIDWLMTLTDDQFSPKPIDTGIRLERLKAEMQNEGIDCSLLFWSRNVYYLCGTSQSGCLIVPVDHEPVLLVRVNLEIAKRETTLADVRELESTKTIRSVLKDFRMEKGKIGIEEKLIPLAFYKKLTSVLSDAEFIDVSETLLKLRMIKQRDEVEHIKKAAEITRICHSTARETLKDGIRENELAAEIEHAMRKAGNEGFVFHNRWGASMFHGMLASGPNIATISGYGAYTITGTGMSPAYPYGASSRKISKGEPVVIDYVGVSGGYHCDEARTYVVGKADDRLREICNLLKTIENAALQAVRPRVAVSEIYEASMRVAQKSRFRDFFMGFGKYQGKYVGHGLGLEIDEPPVVASESGEKLKPGMVLALEPKVMIPNYGGAALEDTLLVTEDGYELLTRTERELFET